jgi:hypothetical protein
VIVDTSTKGTHTNESENRTPYTKWFAVSQRRHHVVEISTIQWARLTGVVKIEGIEERYFATLCKYTCTVCVFSILMSDVLIL